MPAWDLLVRGGALIDPARSVSARRDVAFHGGVVAAVGERLPLPEILDNLKAGDIATHILNGNLENVIGADGRVRREVRAAASCWTSAPRRVRVWDQAMRDLGIVA